MAIPLPFARYRFHLMAEGPMQLPPYKGSLLRGAFGWSFKGLTCITRRFECGPCVVKERCLYAEVFEPEVTGLPRYHQAPRPYVIEPPEDVRTRYAQGEGFAFGLVLIGIRALQALPYFILAMDRCSQRGLGAARHKARLVRVTTEDDEVIYEEDGRFVRSTEDWYGRWQEQVPQEPAHEMAVDFVTPTRLVAAGDLQEEPTFPLFLRSLYRRIEVLCRLYGQPLADGPQALLNEAEHVECEARGLRWVRLQRYSNRQQQKTSLGGFVGRVVYRGDVGPFLPWLVAGTWLHVGKGTTFGLGGYRLATLDPPQGKRRT